MMGRRAAGPPYRAARVAIGAGLIALMLGGCAASDWRAARAAPRAPEFTCAPGQRQFCTDAR